MLKEYNSKRDFKKTPEPSGEPPSESEGALKFVIQKHAARRLHYDFRLEIDGVLVSWAVPKGPALDPAEKRLAVQTEDHPMDYGDFEGIIPRGEYGGGEVIVWDSGTYTPDEEGVLSWNDRDEAQKRMREGFKKGKISIFLEGSKLRGSWTLIKLKKTEKEWLLIKHTDPFSRTDKDPTDEEQSVLSGRTLADVKAGKTAKKVVPTNFELGKVKRFPSAIKPMTASLADKPFSKEGWVFEPKMDGIRAIAYIQDGEVTLKSRNDLDLTDQFPLIVKNLSTYKGSFVLDGEIVALNEKGRPSFQHLQQRGNPSRGARGEGPAPIIFYIFDIIYCQGRSLEEEPLTERRKVLVEQIKPTQEVRIIEQFQTDGESAYEACVANELEGVVGKRVDSTYETGRRSKNWLKIKSTISAEFLICGYTEGTGGRNHTFGSLLLGMQNQQGKLVYVGGVGTGFDDKKLTALMKLMKPLIINKCPFEKKPPGKLNPTWVKPELIAEIKFAEWTQDKILRAPVYLRLRDDIDADEVKPSQMVRTKDLESVKSIKAGVKSETKNNKVATKSSVKPKSTTTKEEDSMTADILEQLDTDKEKLELDVEGNKISFSNLNKFSGLPPAKWKR